MSAGSRADQPRPQRRSWWAGEPRLDRVAYGLPGQVDRIRALGNGVVPQVAEHIGRLIYPHVTATTDEGAAA